MSDRDTYQRKLKNEIQHLELEKKESSSEVDMLFEKHEWISLKGG